VLKDECESIIRYAEVQIKYATSPNSMSSETYIFYKNVISVARLSLRAQKAKAKLHKTITAAIGNAWLKERG